MKTALKKQLTKQIVACRRRANHRGGFTLVEILIVVLILAILAAIVVPSLSHISHDAREAMLKDDLRFMRSALTLYRAQHKEQPVGTVGGSTPDFPTLLAQFTTYSDGQGNTSTTATPVYQYGPYLGSIPKNPLSDKNDVLVVTGGSLPAPDDSTGWIYNATTQEFIANLSALDTNGTPYVNY